MRQVRYLSVCGIACTLTLLAIAAVNAIPDTYSDFCYLTDRCVQGLRLDEEGADEKIKAVFLRQLEPGRIDTAIIGSSRPEIIDPEHSASRAALGRSFNFAFPGATIECMAPIIEAIHRRSPSTLIVVGLDFYAFSIHASHDCRYDADERSSGGVIDALERIASLKTLYDNVTIFTGAGATVGSTRIKQDGARIGRSGADVAQTRVLMRESIDYYVDTPGWYKDWEWNPTALLTLESLSKQAPIVFFVNPISIWHHEALKRTHLEDAFRCWKKKIGALGPVLDFTESPEITNEITNYTDSDHYTADVGDLIVADVARYRAGNVPHNAKIIMQPQFDCSL